MARTPLFELFRQTTRVALASDRRGVPSREAAQAMRMDRRSVLKGLTVAGVGLAVAPARAQEAKPPPSSLRVGIVGGGLAGLACAYDLKRAGILATVHETNDRPGGRVFSLGGTFGGPVSFPGQVAERGGEFIDNGHKTMLGYAQEFNLAKEDVQKVAGEVFYFFGGQRHPESAVVDEYRAFVAAMQPDLRALSGAPTADLHTPVDRQFDLMDLRTYLETRGAGPVVKAAIIAAYEAEYGAPADQQSCLNFLFFIRANRRSRFEPFGSSDERYHLVGGNQQIPRELAARLSGQLRYGERLEAVRKTAAGALQLTFRRGSTAVTATYDAVVLAVPFTVLRGVTLDASLALPAWKTLAIQQLGYGTNAKMMVGFQGPVWSERGCTGTSYSDLADHQSTWETSPTTATTQHAILTDYSSGPRGASLDPSNVAREAERFVAALDRVIPGSAAKVKRGAGGRILAHLEQWTTNPNTRGSYTSYKPGQFTSICGNEGKPVGNLYFAGEHANSFYWWQGFMEGAALSGKDTAAAILQAAKVATL
ncbi:flavin monoamine oxidase family protein [Pyxidicoccus xibeiensis]|uniref:flavin monoamine oxidase family protein n=1 Tax=Pyxidicoccus xibeiensis TaxID=2906759 RepID=UPI0020A78DFA|nr:FAD-dependent oxidoreductase [Pyxidicoccus xibeiensis]MCP3143496.1 FAD-dependent oxidoreductase [Pyxidicoccus xibeiensis]